MVYSDSSINLRINEIRKTLGLTQEQFAGDIKISKAYQGHLERNERPVNDRIIAIISMTYGVSKTWLRTGKGDMFDHFTDPKIEEIIRNFKKLDTKAQEYAQKLIELLVEYESKQ